MRARMETAKKKCMFRFMIKFLKPLALSPGIGFFFLPLLLVATVSANNLPFDSSTPINPPQAPNPTYHSTASEVRLVFFATDKNDHSVEELQKDDFALVDDGEDDSRVPQFHPLGLNQTRHYRADGFKRIGSAAARTR